MKFWEEKNTLGEVLKGKKIHIGETEKKRNEKEDIMEEGI